MVTRIASAAFVVLLLAVPGTVASDAENHTVETNALGLVVRDDSGVRMNYSLAELAGEKSASDHSEAATANSDVASSESGAANAPSLILPVWSFAAFGNAIGASNIVIDGSGGSTEIYLGGAGSTFGGNDYWYALRYDTTGGEYRQVFVSPRYGATIRRIAAADVAASAGNEIVLGLEDGRILIQPKSAKWLAFTIATAASSLEGMQVIDVDGDGGLEFVLTTSNHLYIYGPSGALEWDLPTGGSDVVVAQLDADPALEIALSSGDVVDALTRTVQWTWPAGFGLDLEAADIDDDGMDELIAAEAWYFVWAYDVDRQLPKWSIPMTHDIGAIAVSDIDGDSTVELLVGEGQWGEIQAYDTKTQALEWSVSNPDHGVTDVALADVDSDGKTELLWGAGASSSGPDHLYVVDWQADVIEWQSRHLDGPFFGPEMGDLDGDGIPEIVVASHMSDAGYGSGRIVVFDAALRLRAISDPVAGDRGWTGIHDLTLRDLDGDANLEILVATDWLYDGVVEAYDFSANDTFSLKWTNQTRPSGSPFFSVDARDVDGDGAMEIVAGGGREHTGALGVFIYVYDFATGDEEWHSLQMGEYWDDIEGLTLADFDGDTRTEIAGMVRGGDVYVFDGATKELEAILPGEFTALETLAVGMTPYLLLGDNGGDLILAGATGSSYVELFRGNYLPSAIDGVSFGPGNRSLWLGSEGKLNLVSSSMTLWTSPDYGRPFGRKTLFYPGLPFVLSAGEYSLVGFWILS